MSAKMQIANTAQMKAAFHHGSTVPYGIEVRTITAMSAPNNSLFSKAGKKFSRKGAKTQSLPGSRKVNDLFAAFLCGFAPLREKSYLAFSAVIVIGAAATGSSSITKIRAAASVNSRRNRSVK